MNVIKEENAKQIFSWCPNVDENALEQMKAISRLPYIVHCALMPDAHMGMEMPIGGVVSCNNVVVPKFVGVDIGCGVGAFKTSLHKEDLEDEEKRKKILHSMSRGIPVSFAHNNQKRENELKNRYGDKIEYIIGKTIKTPEHNPVGDYRKQFANQLGTLGGGNHFVEVQYDEEGSIWIMLHSGSRNIGKKVGDYFNDLASELNKKWHSNTPDKIPFLPTNTVQGKSYLAWMNFALKFAYLNRKVMLDEVKDTFKHEFPNVKFITKEVVDDVNDGIINIHHNFCQLENHMGKNVWVHRKGATMAREGMTGIIPGSMGTGSYIVRGLGNIPSLMSCSHGAGRKMGRMEFCRRMDGKLNEVEESLEGIVHSKFSTIERGKNKGKLDVSEAPGAYKDISEVMENQKDLVEPIVKLRPLICLKG